MHSRALLCFLFVAAIASVDCNSEGDALYFWKTKLVDPNNVLQSWDPTLANPCTWFHVTCDSQNSVARLDLGNAGLSGPLVAELGILTNLQYMELYENNFFGPIPSAIGHLSKLVSLDLRVFRNNLTGAIPSSLGNLTSLVLLQLNRNKLTGVLPVEVIGLVRFGKLLILDVSSNLLVGTVHRTNSTGFIVTKIVQDPRAQKPVEEEE
ncbi:hypothetical protein ACLB2K_034508 [Fragaria x ananassa]